jgi:hypothetical protein
LLKITLLEEGCMLKVKLGKELTAIAISLLLIFLIFFILIPPATAVYLYPGTPSSTSINTGSTITFRNINLTIRGYEKIPINNLTFKIFNNANNQQVGYVIFYINGTEKEDYPSGKFTVSNTTAIGEGWNEYGYQNGTDEYDNSEHDFGYGYGYGYGSGSIDITFLYDITYKTHTTGTFYAKLLVNSTSYTYTSDKSTRFTVSTPGGGGGFVFPIEEEEETPEITKEEKVTDLFGIELQYNFSATDINGDGIIDTFTDPNGILFAEHNVIINGNSSFLISIGGDIDKIFIWDTESDTITQVTHINGTIIDTITDTNNKTITVKALVIKNNWIYFEIKDYYIDISDLTVKTSDGRTVSNGMIWRTDNKIYVLDDPTVEYQFIYSYEGFLFDVILELTKNSVIIGEKINALITLINVGEPGLVNGTVVYTLYKENTVVWSITESVSIQGQKAFNKTISTKDLKIGKYTYEVVFNYGDNQIASSFKTFTIKSQPSAGEFPLWIPIVIIIILIIILIIVYLYKKGYLYF